MTTVGMEVEEKSAILHNETHDTLMDVCFYPLTKQICQLIKLTPKMLLGIARSPIVYIFFLPELT